MLQELGLRMDVFSRRNGRYVVGSDRMMHSWNVNPPVFPNRWWRKRKKWLKMALA